MACALTSTFYLLMPKHTLKAYNILLAYSLLIDHQYITNNTLLTGKKKTPEGAFITIKLDSN